MSSSLESCGICEPTTETKEVLLKRARCLAKQAAEMSGGADSGPREFFYGASNFNPEIPSFTPANASSTTSSPAVNTQSQASPSTPPKSELNPESKVFVPKPSTLNVGAAPFIPPSLVVAPPETDAEAVATEIATVSLSKDNPVDMAMEILYQANEDPSSYDPLMKDFLHKLKEGNVSAKDLGPATAEVLQQGVSSPTMHYIAARMCGTMNDELDGFRREMMIRLQMMVMETQDKPAEEVTLVACFLAEIFTRVTVREGEYREHLDVLKVVLMQFLEKLFGSNASDTTVQTGCNILKLTGGILESMEATSEAKPAIAMDQIFQRLEDLAKGNSISSSTKALVTRVVQLRRGSWGHQSPKREAPAVKLVMSTKEDGFVYFKTVNSDETASKGGGSVDWEEYVDEGGTPYCDDLQSASSGLEDQFDIDAEFEQFQAEEYWHYVDPSYIGEEEGFPDEPPDQ